MHKPNLIKTFIPVVFILGLLSGFSYAESYELPDLLTSPDSFDGKVITLEAEVVGEILRENSGAWINILSQGKNIGVFSEDPEVFKAITHWGSYKQIGDKVRIRGVFYKNCPQHKTSDIHLQDLKVLEKGHKNSLMVTPSRRRLAMISFIICLTTAIIYFISLKYGKRA